jgi:probable rRNA maturation factor
LYLPPWRIDIDVRAGTPRVLPARALARAVAAALDAAGAPRPASVGVVLTDDAELAGLNKRHMGKSGPTDVLSFPILPGVRQPLGDVVVSVQRAIAQAEAGRGGQTGDVRWSSADELRLLVTHGTLHLCGWDHAEAAEEAAMRALEQRLLAPAREGPLSRAVRASPAARRRRAPLPAR